jgi:DNA replicative helicase MCM subunit Mcm2 (Cdc46/Mcm family)
MLDKIEHGKFETAGSWICVGNPRNQQYDPNLNIKKNINFKPAFLTRFDLIWVIRRFYDHEKTQKRLNKLHNTYDKEEVAKYDKEWLKK